MLYRPSERDLLPSDFSRHSLTALLGGSELRSLTPISCTPATVPVLAHVSNTKAKSCSSIRGRPIRGHSIKIIFITEIIQIYRVSPDGTSPNGYLTSSDSLEERGGLVGWGGLASMVASSLSDDHTRSETEILQESKRNEKGRLRCSCR